MRAGQRVRVERDETLYPAKGTWKQFRGRTGTITSVNRDKEQPSQTEYGVAFGESRSGIPTWFKDYELTAIKARDPKAANE